MVNDTTVCLIYQGQGNKSTPDTVASCGRCLTLEVWGPTCFPPPDPKPIKRFPTQAFSSSFLTLRSCLIGSIQNQSQTHGSPLQHQSTNSAKFAGVSMTAPKHRMQQIEQRLALSKTAFSETVVGQQPSRIQNCIAQLAEPSFPELRQQAFRLPLDHLQGTHLTRSESQGGACTNAE